LRIAGAVIAALGLLGLSILIARSCARGSDDTAVDGGTTAPPIRVRAPLTGLDSDAPIRPALMVKIDNVDAARPQAGLFAADVIFEELVEGGLTRFGAVYSSTDPGSVGPVRSVRGTDLHIASLLGRPALAYSGGAVPVLARVTAASDAGTLVPVSPGNVPGAFFRRDDRRAPHDLWARTSGLWEAADGAALPDALFAFGPVGPGLPVHGFAVSFPATQIAYRWDAEAGRWARSQTGADQIDADRPDETFGVDNVLVLLTIYRPSSTDESSPELDLEGGEAWLYRDGVVSKCLWSISAPPAARIALHTEAGTVCGLKAGRTLVELATSPPTTASQ
jgi:hypothetical protein